MGHWGDACLVTLAMPYLAVSGAIKGAAKGVPAAEIEEGETALKSALAELNFQKAIQDQVVQTGRDRTGRPFVPLAEQGPTSADEMIGYRSFAGQGIDTVLEIAILNLRLRKSSPPEGDRSWDTEVERLVNPPLALVVTVRTKLVRVADGTEIYSYTSKYTSGTRTFTGWTVSNAQPFREELELAYQNLAKQIVELLFPAEAAPDLENRSVPVDFEKVPGGDS